MRDPIMELRPASALNVGSYVHVSGHAHRVMLLVRSGETVRVTMRRVDRNGELTDHLTTANVAADLPFNVEAIRYLDGPVRL